MFLPYLRYESRDRILHSLCLARLTAQLLVLAVERVVLVLQLVVLHVQPLDLGRLGAVVPLALVVQSTQLVQLSDTEEMAG